MLYFFVLPVVWLIFAINNIERFKMSETFVLIGILIFIFGGFFLLNKFYRNKPVTTDHHDHVGEDGVCCGRHANCSKTLDKDNLYFDDEELDRYKKRNGHDYTDEEVEEFRNILYTMQTNEIEEWATCLQTRGIAIPQEIKDEILLMLQ